MARQKVQHPPHALGNKKDSRENMNDVKRKSTTPTEDTSKKNTAVYLSVVLGIIAICLQFMRPQVNNYYPPNELVETVQKLTEKLEYFHLSYSREFEQFHQRIQTIDTRMKDIDKVSQERLEKYDNKLLNARSEMAESAMQVKHYVGIVNELESQLMSLRSVETQLRVGGKISNHEVEILRNELEILNENFAIEKSAVVSKMKKLTKDGRRDRDKINHLSESLETMATSIVNEIRSINSSLIGVKDTVARGKSEWVTMVNTTSLENRVNRTSRKMEQQEVTLQSIQNSVDGITRELNNYVTLLQFRNETDILKSEFRNITSDLISKKLMALMSFRIGHAAVHRLKIAVYYLRRELMESGAAWENMNITVTSALTRLLENRKSGQEKIMLLLKKLQKNVLNYRGQQTYLYSHVINMTDDIKKLSEEWKLWNYFIDARMNSIQDKLQDQNVSIRDMVAREIKQIQALVSFRDVLTQSPIQEFNTSRECYDAKDIGTLTDQFNALLAFKLGLLQSQVDEIRGNTGYVDHHGNTSEDTGSFVEFVKFSLRGQVDSIRREMTTKQAKFERENTQYLEFRLNMLENSITSLKSAPSTVTSARGDNTCDGDVIGYVEFRLNLLRSQIQYLNKDLEIQKTKTNENWKIHLLQWQLQQANSMLLEHELRLNETAPSSDPLKGTYDTFSSANIVRDEFGGLSSCQQKSVQFEHYLMSAEKRMENRISETLRRESDSLKQYLAFYEGLRDGELQSVRTSLSSHDQELHVLQEQLSQSEKGPSFPGLVHQHECRGMTSQVSDLADKYGEVKRDLKQMYDFQRFLEFLHQSDYETMSARTSELSHQRDMLTKLVEEQNKNQTSWTENMNYLLHEQGRKTAEIMKKLKTVVENNKAHAYNELASVNHTIMALIRDMKKNERKQMETIKQLQQQHSLNSRIVDNLLSNNSTSNVNTKKEMSGKRSKSTKALNSKLGNVDIVDIEGQHLMNLESSAHVQILTGNRTKTSIPPELLAKETQSVAKHVDKHNNTETSKANIHQGSP